jgi:hypothetical protein
MRGRLTPAPNDRIIRLVTKHRFAGLIPALVFLSSCAAVVTPAQRDLAQAKAAEFQLAAAVVSRTQTCFETLLPELRAMVDGSEGALTEREFAAKWGLGRFDPNTGFNDALAACVGKPTLQDLGIKDNETPLTFLDRKREESQPTEAEKPRGRKAAR